MSILRKKKKELQFREIILDEKSGKHAYLTKKKINNVIALFKNVKVTDDGNVAISKKKDDRKRRNLQRYSIIAGERYCKQNRESTKGYSR